MKIRIQFIIESESQSLPQDIFCLEREELTTETLGLTLQEAKTIIPLKFRKR